MILDLTAQITKDSEFMERSNIMDYSLLIGIHVIDKDKENSAPTITPRDPSVFHKQCYGGILSSNRDIIYYLGIIDCLTCWNMKKNE